MADYFRNVDRFEYKYNHRTAKGVKYTVVDDLEDEPITLEEVKQHLRIDFNVDDNLITLYAKAARIWLEKYTQRSFGVKTMQLTALSLPDSYKILYGPVNELNGSDYEVFQGYLKTGGENVVIEYTTTDEFFEDDNIKNAIAMEAASRYMIRESIPINDNGNSPGQLTNLAKQIVQEYKEIIL